MADPSSLANPGRIWAPLSMMAVISIFSSSAGLQAGPVYFVGIDKVGHFIVFGLLAIAWIRGLEYWIRGQNTGLCLAVGLTFVFGLLDEWHQLHTPGRYFEWADLGADLIGALFFSTAFLYIPFFRKFLELDFRAFQRLISQDKSANSAR